MRLIFPRPSSPTAAVAAGVKSDRNDVTELVRQVGDLQRALAACPFTYGTQVDFRIEASDPPTVLSGTTIVRHKLGRVPRGWLLLDLVTPIVLTAVTRLGWDAVGMTLFADRECSGRVLVF